MSIFSEVPNEITFAEDELFVCAFISCVKSIYIENRPFYYYRMRGNSATNSINENFLSELNKKYLFIKKYYEKNQNSKLLIQQLKYKTVKDMLSMRFLADGAAYFYMFPYELILPKASVVLYGAGNVGKSYYKQISVNNYCDIILWADVRFKELGKDNIKNPDEILNCEFDYLLIAIADANVISNIKNELIEKYKIDDKKIITYMPKTLVNFFDL